MAEIIVALDVASPEQALGLVDTLPGLRWAKVGPTLFVAGGLTLIRELKDRRLKVFLDLKWHDIPHTVAGAVEAAASLGVAMATVHTLGGAAMLTAAPAAAGELGADGVDREVGVLLGAELAPDALLQVLAHRLAGGAR